VSFLDSNLLFVSNNYFELIVKADNIQGVLIIGNYGVLLYSSLGMKTFMPLLLSALWVTASFPGNIFTALMIDRIGRRTFMLTGTAGITVTLILETCMQKFFLGTTNTAGQKAAIFFIFLFIFFWSSFIDASQYLYVSEIFPTHLRAQGMAVSMTGLYSGAIILLCAGPIALDVIKWKFFLILIVMNSLHWFIIFFFYPETKQRSLEDINESFGDKVAVHYYNATIEDEEVYAKMGVGEKHTESDLKAPGDTSPVYEHTENVVKI
jgi:MFS family permease